MSISFILSVKTPDEVRLGIIQELELRIKRHADKHFMAKTQKAKREAKSRASELQLVVDYLKDLKIEEA